MRARKPQGMGKQSPRAAPGATHRLTYKHRHFSGLLKGLVTDCYADFPPGIDTNWLAEELANRLGQYDSLVLPMEELALRWSRNPNET